MFGDNLKRQNSGRLSDPKAFPRKIARYDQGSGYAANSNLERVNGSSPNSRQSSMSLQHTAEQAGYGTPQSRSPSLRSGHEAPISNNMEAIPKALEGFVLAISNRNQTSHHLNNVRCDYESMMPKHADFPAVKMQKANRLTQAQKDNEIVEAQAAIATKLLLDTLQGHIPGQLGPTSHQDCVSRTELDSLKAQLQEIKSENREIKKKLGLVDRRLDDETKIAQRSEQYAAKRMTEIEGHITTTEDRMAKIEEVNRATCKTISSAVSNYKSLQDQTLGDRLSSRTRFSTLEDYMDKSKTKHNENAQAISDVQSTLQVHMGESDKKHKEHMLKIDLSEANINTLQRTFDVDVVPRIKANSDAAAAAHKALENLDFQSKLIPEPRPPVVTAIAAPIPAIDELAFKVDSIALKMDSNESRMAKVETNFDGYGVRLNDVERSIERIDDENETKDGEVGEQILEFNTRLDELQRDLGNDVRDIGKELEDLEAWKDLQTHIRNLRYSLNDQDANVKTKIEELRMHTGFYVEELRSTTKDAMDKLSSTTRLEMDELRSSSNHTSQLLDNHVELLQRHEGRLNSVTTDELVRMMENQWRSTYGAPDQLKGLISRLSKLENFTRGTFKGLDPTVTALRIKVDGLAADAQARLEAIEKDVQSLKTMS